ncbi:MAG TPA: 2-phosphosulfolactate phosphatase [Verrucomicrobiae bacterium]|jgi:2-phosphosulfolactate phosphatase|nr:2-phosphosulfolactate phosphatase [Verrucomicrobiae bacterium]
MNKLEVLFSPAEFAVLKDRDLYQTVCVVFDVLRATTTMVTALANGASVVIPVSEISEAVAIRKKDNTVLLGGERDGVKIRAAQTGGVDFDFGNSPREYTAAKVRGHTIVSTTTNGTRALRACAGAMVVLAGTFNNLGATASFLEKIFKQKSGPTELLLVCAGTQEEAAYEDTLCAGALGDALWPLFDQRAVSDSAQIARQIYLFAKHDLLGAVQAHSKNGRRLLAMPELHDDVAFCLQRDTCKFLAGMNAEGKIYRINEY